MIAGSVPHRGLEHLREQHQVLLQQRVHGLHRLANASVLAPDHVAFLIEDVRFGLRPEAAAAHIAPGLLAGRDAGQEGLAAALLAQLLADLDPAIDGVHASRIDAVFVKDRLVVVEDLRAEGNGQRIHLALYRHIAADAVQQLVLEHVHVVGRLQDDARVRHGVQGSRLRRNQIRKILIGAGLIGQHDLLAHVLSALALNDLDLYALGLLRVHLAPELELLLIRLRIAVAVDHQLAGRILHGAVGLISFRAGTRQQKAHGQHQNRGNDLFHGYSPFLQSAYSRVA